MATQPLRKNRNRKAEVAAGERNPGYSTEEDILGHLRRIRLQLDQLNERENLNVWAPATPEARIAPGIQARTSLAPVAPAAPVGPQPTSVFVRLDVLDQQVVELAQRLSDIYSRVSNIEQALFGDVGR